MIRSGLAWALGTLGLVLMACGSADADAGAGDSSTDEGTSSSGGTVAEAGASSSTSSTSSSGQSTSGGPSSSSSGSSSGGDGGVGDGGVGESCGTRRCVGSETCVNTVCVLPACDGVRVPGDYATVQAAAQALALVGGTVCIEPGSYAEDVRIANAHGLVLQGRSAETTKLRSVHGDADATGLTLRGLGMLQPSQITDGAVTLEHCSFEADSVTPALDAASGSAERLSLTVRHSRFAAPNGTALRVRTSFEEVTAELDGLDLSGQTALAYGPHEVTGGSLQLQNSYVHDSEFGVFAVMYAGALSVRSSTFVDAKRAIVTEGYPSSSRALAWYNVLITGSEVAVRLHKAALQSHNALFGNTTNYAGAAEPGPSFVSVDCSLDGASPPAPAAASPCRSAGTAEYAPLHDYFGTQRSTPPSIGAVD